MSLKVTGKGINTVLITLVCGHTRRYDGSRKSPEVGKTVRCPECERAPAKVIV